MGGIAPLPLARPDAQQHPGTHGHCQYNATSISLGYASLIGCGPAAGLPPGAPPPHGTRRRLVGAFASAVLDYLILASFGKFVVSKGSWNHYLVRRQ